MKKVNRDELNVPTFLYIGTGRSGSTWFFEVLREHPDVQLPANKGTFFFTKFYELGPSWYEAFFRGQRRHVARGEVCEDYLASSDAMRRIKSYRNDMRLICCLRNPYERAISAWRFLNRNGVGCSNLAEQGRCRPEIFNMGNYGSQLQIVRSLFPEDQILVFLFDDVVSSPNKVVEKLYRFIGVNYEFRPPSVNRTINPNGKPRSRLLARIVNGIHMRSWGGSRFLSNFAGAIKRVRLLRTLVRTALYDERPDSGDWLEWLVEFPPEVIARFEGEITRLEEILEVDLSHWRAPTELLERVRAEHY